MEPAQHQPATEQSSAETKKKPSNTSFFIFVGFVVLIFLLIFMGFKIYSSPHAGVDSYTYNSFTFSKYDLFWWSKLTINSKPVYLQFRYGPRELENISITPGIEEIIKNKGAIYFTSSPNLSSKTSLAQIEVGRLIGMTDYSLYQVPAQAGLTEQTGNMSIPVITCANATNIIGVMLFTTGNQTAVYAEGDCIVVQGTNEQEIIRAAERLAYHLLKIMD
jgi:uncharacterized membrane protein